MIHIATCVTYVFDGLTASFLISRARLPGFRGTAARILAAPIRLLYCQLGVNYVPHLRNRLPAAVDIDRAITAAAELLD